MVGLMPSKADYSDLDFYSMPKVFKLLKIII